MRSFQKHENMLWTLTEKCIFRTCMFFFNKKNQNDLNAVSLLMQYPLMIQFLPKLSQALITGQRSSLMRTGKTTISSFKLVIGGNTREYALITTPRQHRSEVHGQPIMYIIS
jgi:hypothetical protein